MFMPAGVSTPSARPNKVMLQVVPEGLVQFVEHF